MNDLIWIGNTLYPRWFVFAVTAVAIVAASFAIGAVIVGIQELVKWIFRGLRP